MDQSDIQNLINTTLDAREKSNGYSPSTIPYHTHSGADSPLITAVQLQANNPVLLGYGAVISFSPTLGTVTPGTAGEEVINAIVAGKDQSGTIARSELLNMQVQLEHYPQDPNNFSYFDGFRPPIYSNAPDTTTNVTSGGSTVTVTNYTIPINSLVGALIDISDSSGNLIETHTIASNTATVITINGTWSNTTTGGSFFVFVPVFLGRNLYPWQRLYVMDGTGGGVRFGPGPTNGGQNGLLYTDSSGNIFYRNYAGTSTQLNISGAGANTVNANENSSTDFTVQINFPTANNTSNNGWSVVSAGSGPSYAPVAGSGFQVSNAGFASAIANARTPIIAPSNSNIGFFAADTPNVIRLRFYGRSRSATSSTTVRAAIGFSNLTGSSDFYSETATDGLDVKFVFDTRIATGFPTMYAVCSNGAAVTSVNLHLDPTAFHIYEIVLTPYTSAAFYVDGVLATTITTDLYTSGSQTMNFEIGSFSSSNATDITIYMQSPIFSIIK